jgi:hypothetical protein
LYESSREYDAAFESKMYDDSFGYKRLAELALTTRELPKRLAVQGARFEV